MPQVPPRSATTAQPARPIALTARALQNWPLPRMQEGGDKDDRGSVLIAGGATEVPGAIILAGVAALRAGAGKLQLMTCRTVAALVATTIPEARVTGLAEQDGDIAPGAAAEIAERANAVAATLIGPGMMNIDGVHQLMRDLLPRLEGGTLVLDAAALVCITRDPTAVHGHQGKVILTPHAGEMALMRGIDKEEVGRDPLGLARQAAREWQAVVVLKGAETFIAAPDGLAYHFKGGSIGLATSGSGDTLAGVITGLAARGATPLQAAAWGVYLHGTAGQRLSREMGQVGFLARELLAEIPPLLHRLSRSSPPR